MNDLREVLGACLAAQAEPDSGDAELDRLLDDRIEKLETRLMVEHDACGPEMRSLLRRAAGR